MYIVLLSCFVAVSALNHRFVHNKRQTPIIHSNIPPQLSSLVSSTAIIGMKDMLVYDSNEHKYLFPANDKNTMLNIKGVELPLCPSDEAFKLPFSRMMFATGFLVSPSLFVTAGHFCSKKEFKEKYNDFAVLFDYETLMAGTNPLIHSANSKMDESHYVADIDSVYFFKKPIKREYNEGWKRFPISAHSWIDYAILELDRDVDLTREFAKVSLSFNNQIDVVTVGHPSSGPKMFDYGKITKTFKKNFQLMIDIAGGSSGSPVGDLKTGSVIGILTNSVRDYEKKTEKINGKRKSCWKRTFCSGSKCSFSLGKDVPVTAAAMSQLFSSLDPNPIRFPILSKDNSIKGGARIKALQIITSFNPVDGIWTDAFTERVRVFGISRKNQNRKYIVPLNFKGNVVLPPLLSLLIPDKLTLGDCKTLKDSPICRGIHAVRVLLRGHNYSVDGDEQHEYDTKLENIVNQFKKSKGYKEDGIIDRPIWRHLFHTIVDKPLFDNLYK